MKRDEKKPARGGCCTLFCIVFFIGLAVLLFHWHLSGRVPKQTVLEADFSRGVVESAPADPVARVFFGRKPSVLEIVEALRRAAGDDRVKGLVARIGESKMKLAQVQELRDAVLAFRAKGKRAVAFAETFGEAGPGNASYYLATAFDEILMQPSGTLGLTGLIYENMFLKGTLDKLGVVPRIDARKEYKSIKYLFTERKYPKPEREEMEQVMNSQFAQMVGDIAAARKMPENEVRTLIDRGPFIGKDAVDAKFVDRLAYRDEVYAAMKERAGKKAAFLDLAEYLRRAGSPYKKGATVALIYGVGSIASGKSRYNPVTGETVMGSDTVAEAFRRAAEDEDVKAVLFRIDSPGGSYLASDTIRREVANARKAGKPVIVSMGSVAASGGYFIAMAADRIVAQPATVTGSIGVVGGKMITTGLWNKLGVTWDEVHTSTNADAWTATKDLSPAQKVLFGQWLDRVYDDFTTKVSESRKLPKDEVLKIAKGRIWTGEDAKRLGLVDELGGFPAALRLVRKAAKLPDGAKLRLKLFPERKSLLRRIWDRDFSGDTGRSLETLRDALEEVQPLARMVESAEGGRRDVLKMPEFE